MKTIRNIFIGTILFSFIAVPVVKAQSIDLVEKTEVYNKEHIPKKNPVPYPFTRESDVMCIVMWGVFIAPIWILSPFVFEVLFLFQ